MSQPTRRSPNVPLVIVGLVTAGASALTLGHLVGWQLPSLADVAPESVLLAGLAILLAGVVGLTRERRRSRSPNRATRPPTSS